VAAGAVGVQQGVVGQQDRVVAPDAVGADQPVRGQRLGPGRQDVVGRADPVEHGFPRGQAEVGGVDGDHQGAQRDPAVRRGAGRRRGRGERAVGDGQPRRGRGRGAAGAPGFPRPSADRRVDRGGGGSRGGDDEQGQESGEQPRARTGNRHGSIPIGKAGALAGGVFSVAPGTDPRGGVVPGGRPVAGRFAGVVGWSGDGEEYRTCRARHSTGSPGEVGGGTPRRAATPDDPLCRVHSGITSVW